jgi:ketosteroid isomerase-like protein
MSQDRVVTVRSIYEHWAEGDFRATFDLFDQNVVFVMPPELPDAGTYLGNEAVAEYTRGFLEPWEHITMEAEELLSAGDSVLASIVQRATGEASGAATEIRYLQLWTFRGDKVIRLENFRERDQALQAAGLENGPAQESGLP